MDYDERLKFLIMRFSQLSYDFGAQWLSMKTPPSLEIDSTQFTFSWPSDFKGRWLAVTVRDIKFVVPATSTSNSITIKWPANTFTDGFFSENITAEVIAFSTQTAGTPTYRFYSQGPRSTSSPAWCIIRSPIVGDTAGTNIFPTFDDYSDVDSMYFISLEQNDAD